MRTPAGSLILSLLLQVPGYPAGKGAATGLEFSPSPIVYQVSPLGAQVGASTWITVEGINLEDSPRLIFSRKGVEATATAIEPAPNPPYRTPRQRVRIRLDVDSEAEIGSHGFRMKTVYGTSNWVRFALGTLPQIEAMEPEEKHPDGREITLPVTVEGRLDRGTRGDVFRFRGESGQELVFRVEASSLGSRMDSVLEFMDGEGQVLARNDNFFPGSVDSVLAVTCPRDGEYRIRISDRAGRGGRAFAYRLTLGRLPFLTGVFPLGLRRGSREELAVTGHNLGGRTTIRWDDLPPDTGKDTLQVRLRTPLGPSLNTLPVVLGDTPEILEAEPNDAVANAQPLPVPVTVNGRTGAPGDQDLFSFAARRDETLILEVWARRLSSPLDSVLQVLDVEGRPVPGAVLEVLSEDFHDGTLSASNLFLNRFGLKDDTRYYPLDFVLLDRRELIRLERSIRRADHFSVAQGILGKRISWLGTDPQNHPINGSVHKVLVRDPGTPVSEELFPAVTLPYRNDDGGPLTGKDSYLLFRARMDGTYLAHLGGLGGAGGPRYAYRLTIRRAEPDFRLFLDDGYLLYIDGRATGARNPNVPRGGSVPLTVSAARTEGFEGPIRVRVEDLPPGFHATEGLIRPREMVTTLVLSALETAQEPDEPFRLRVVGEAVIGGRTVSRTATDPAEPLNLVSLAPSPPIVPRIEPPNPVIRPGENIRLTIHIQRNHGFRLDVPFILQNRPAGIWVEDSGSNGIVISKDETSRTLTLRADPWIEPMTFPLLAVGRIKSEAVRKRRSGAKAESADYTTLPLPVRVAPRED